VSITCLFCNTDLADDAKFCTSCGNKVPRKEPKPNSSTSAKAIKKKMPLKYSKETVATINPDLIDNKSDLSSELKLCVDNIFLAPERLEKIRTHLENNKITFSSLEPTVKEIFLSGTNLNLKKVLFEMFNSQINDSLKREKDIPSSTRFLTKIY